LVELDPGALSGKKKTKHLRDLIKDESQLRTTQVIQESLNPVWNEEFELTVGNFNTQYLQIDIWDSDEEAETVGNALKSHVKGFAGIGRYFRQVAETTFRGAQDDFMGRVYIPLRELPPQGIDSAFHIQSKRQHTKKGELHVKVQLVAEQKTRRQSLSPQDAFTEHTKLQNLFIDHESREFIKHGGAYWHGQLSSPALQMLDQHAIQNNMTELDHVICEWIVVVEHNEKQGVDYKYILQVIERLREQWGEVQQKVGNPEKELGQGKVQLLLNAMRGFREWSYSMLAKLRVIYPANNKKALTKLENLLKCLKKFYEFELIKQKLPGQNFNLFVAGAIKQSTSSWLAERQALLEPQVTTDDALTMAVVELVSDIVVDLYQAVDVYNVLMEPMGVDYIGLVFKQIDILLSPVVETKMKDANQKFLDLEIESEEFRLLSVASFQLYLSITELNRFKSHLPEQTVASSKLFQNLHAWFEPMVTRWIDLADLKTIARIDKAVELDEVKGVSDSAKYSTSAVDTSLCLLHVCDIWKKLAWPLSPAAFEFVVRLAKVTCKGASHYTERMHIILERTGYYDAEGQFDVTVQLCITLNNINYVRKTLDTLPDCLKWDQLVSDLDLSGDSEAAESSRAKLWGQVTSANNGIVKKRSQIISRIGEKMGADILGYVLPLVTSPESTPAHDV
jgi:BAI1-associated protein 3